MFIQVIQGRCNDADALHRQMDRWREELEPGATGWLGGTYGITDDDEFVGVVRFDSRASAEAQLDAARAGRVVGGDGAAASTARSASTTATTSR